MQDNLLIYAFKNLSHYIRQLTSPSSNTPKPRYDTIDDKLPAISELVPEAFQGVYSYWQLPSSSHSSDNKQCEASSFVTLDPEQQSKIKEAIDAHDLLRIKTLLGAETSSNCAIGVSKKHCMMWTLQDEYRSWVEQCCKLLVNYAIEGALTQELEKGRSSGILSGEVYKEFQKKISQQLQENFIDNADAVLKAFSPHGEVYPGFLRIYDRFYSHTQSKIRVWSFYTERNLFNVRDALEKQIGFDEKYLDPIYRKQIKLSQWYRKIDSERIWDGVANDLFESNAFPDVISHEAALAQLQPLRASGIASHPLGRTLLIDEPDQQLSLLDYALLKSEAAGPKEQGFFFSLIDYLIKRGAMLSFVTSERVASMHSGSTVTLRRRLLVDPIETVFAWHRLQRLGLLPHLGQQHLERVLKEPYWCGTFLDYSMFSIKRAELWKDPLREALVVIKADKLPVTRIQLKTWLSEDKGITRARTLLRDMCTLPALKILDARNAGLTGADLLVLCREMIKQQSAFTAWMGETLPSDDKQCIVPKKLTVTPAMAQVIQYADQQGFLSRQFLEQLESFRIMHGNPQEKLLPVLETLAGKKLATSWAVNFLMREAAEHWSSLSVIIHKANQYSLLSMHFLANLQHHVLPETYSVLAQLCKYLSKDDGQKLLVLCTYSFAIKNLSQAFGYKQTMSFTPEALKAERDSIQWRDLLACDFNVSAKDTKYDHVASHDFMKVYFTCVASDYTVSVYESNTNRASVLSLNEDGITKLTKQHTSKSKIAVGSINTLLPGFTHTKMGKMPIGVYPQANVSYEKSPVLVGFVQTKPDSSSSWTVDTLTLRVKNRRLTPEGLNGLFRVMSVCGD